MDSSRFDYDVAVVGAGPAGSGTARSLAARGYRVALLERDPAPGEPVHCTGIVSDECFKRYDLPASLVIGSVSSFVLRSPSGRPARVQRRTVQAYVLDRVRLDRWLAELPSIRDRRPPWVRRSCARHDRRAGLAPVSRTSRT